VVSPPFSLSRSRREVLFALLLLAPCLAAVLGLIGYPYLYLGYISLFDAQGQFTPSAFWDTVTDPYFSNGLKISAIFTVVSVMGTTLLGLALAFLVDVVGKGERLWRTLFIVPFMIPTVVATMAWKILFQPAFGLAPYLLGLAGFPSIDFLGSGRIALWSTLLVNLWIAFPFPFIVFAAAIKALPREPFESARIDGASTWQTFRYLTFPFIRPIVLLVVIFRTVWSFQEFEEIYILTRGGPGTSTLNLYVLAFLEAFLWAKLNIASVIILIMAIIVGIASGIYIIVLRRSTLR
jgi:multiple sugar transport system permease protein